MARLKKKKKLQYNPDHKSVPYRMHYGTLKGSKSLAQITTVYYSF
jgi:hypothetical protein